MYCDIGSISLGKSYSDNSSWSSPFSISSYEDDNLKTAVTRPSEVPRTGYSDRSENRQTFARSMDDMDEEEKEFFKENPGFKKCFWNNMVYLLFRYTTQICVHIWNFSLYLDTQSHHYILCVRVFHNSSKCTRYLTIVSAAIKNLLEPYRVLRMKIMRELTGSMPGLIMNGFGTKLLKHNQKVPLFLGL
ncbi:hypothetical protein DINM_004798 [Dirofilaria immitis]|nr:hypothetical protein [Dirofilaria immitis]